MPQQVVWANNNKFNGWNKHTDDCMWAPALIEILEQCIVPGLPIKSNADAHSTIYSGFGQKDNMNRSLSQIPSNEWHHYLVALTGNTTIFYMKACVHRAIKTNNWICRILTFRIINQISINFVSVISKHQSILINASGSTCSMFSHHKLYLNKLSCHFILIINIWKEERRVYNNIKTATKFSSIFDL